MATRERRPGRRSGITTIPNTALERSLRDLQRTISTNNMENREMRQARDQIAAVLFYENGYTQQMIADLMTAESEKVGDQPIGEDGVQKALRRLAS